MDEISAMQFGMYSIALMRMNMRDMASQAQEMVEMLSDVPAAAPTVSAPAQYNFDVWA